MVPNTNQERGQTHQDTDNNKTFNCQSTATSATCLPLPKAETPGPIPSKRWHGLDMLHLTMWNIEAELHIHFQRLEQLTSPRSSLLSHGLAVVIPLQRLLLLVQLYEVTALSVCFPLSGLAFRHRQLPAEVPSYLQYVLSNFVGSSSCHIPACLQCTKMR